MASSPLTSPRSSLGLIPEADPSLRADPVAAAMVLRWYSVPEIQFLAQFLYQDGIDSSYSREAAQQHFLQLRASDLQIAARISGKASRRGFGPGANSFERADGDVLRRCPLRHKVAARRASDVVLGR